MTEEPKVPYDLLTGNEIEIGDILLSVWKEGPISICANRVYGIKLDHSGGSKKFSILIDHKEEVNPDYAILLKKDGRVFLGKELYDRVTYYIENPKPLVPTT